MDNQPYLPNQISQPWETQPTGSGEGSRKKGGAWQLCFLIFIIILFVFFGMGYFLYTKMFKVVIEGEKENLIVNIPFGYQKGTLPLSSLSKSLEAGALKMPLPIVVFKP